SDHWQCWPPPWPDRQKLPLRQFMPNRTTLRHINNQIISIPYQVNRLAHRLQSPIRAIRPGIAERASPPETETSMSFSVNTNNGAAIALQYLNLTQGQLDKTQSAINSGLKVASAKDDGAIYAIAQNQRGAVAGYQAVLNSINNGSSA